MYVLIHIRLCGREGDEKIFTRLISGNKNTFLALLQRFSDLQLVIIQKEINKLILTKLVYHSS